MIGWFLRQGKEASIAAMGGQFSVVVDREHVTYSATVLKADVPKAMEILATAAKVGPVCKPFGWVCQGMRPERFGWDVRDEVGGDESD